MATAKKLGYENAQSLTGGMGAWRAASHYLREHGSLLWGWLARLVLMLGALQLAVSVAFGLLPRLDEFKPQMLFVSAGLLQAAHDGPIAPFGQESSLFGGILAPKGGIAKWKTPELGNDLLMRPGMQGHLGIRRQSLCQKLHGKRLICRVFGMFKGHVEELPLRLGRAQVPAFG